MTEAWRQYAADFEAMTNKKIEDERQRSQYQIAIEKEWLDAVAAWKAAGRPRP